MNVKINKNVLITVAGVALTIGGSIVNGLQQKNQIAEAVKKQIEEVSKNK